jgi:hypothetical protein
MVTDGRWFARKPHPRRTEKAPWVSAQVAGCGESRIALDVLEDTVPTERRHSGIKFPAQEGLMIIGGGTKWRQLLFNGSRGTAKRGQSWNSTSLQKPSIGFVIVAAQLPSTSSRPLVEVGSPSCRSTLISQARTWLRTTVSPATGRRFCCTRSC